MRQSERARHQGGADYQTNVRAEAIEEHYALSHRQGEQVDVILRKLGAFMNAQLNRKRLERYAEILKQALTEGLGRTATIALLAVTTDISVTDAPCFVSAKNDIHR